MWETTDWAISCRFQGPDLPRLVADVPVSIYPPPMDGNPPPDGRGAEPRPPGARGDPGAESFGPLAVRRMTKDDGRSLIVYERADPLSQAGSGEPGPRGARA